MSEKYKEFWISPSKTWSDETQSYSIEKTSVDIITEDSLLKLIMDTSVGIRVIEYAALEAHKEIIAELIGALDGIRKTSISGSEVYSAADDMKLDAGTAWNEAREKLEKLK